MRSYSDKQSEVTTQRKSFMDHIGRKPKTPAATITPAIAPASRQSFAEYVGRNNDQKIISQADSLNDGHKPIATSNTPQHKSFGELIGRASNASAKQPNINEQTHNQTTQPEDVTDEKQIKQQIFQHGLRQALNYIKYKSIGNPMEQALEDAKIKELIEQDSYYSILVAKLYVNEVGNIAKACKHYLHAMVRGNKEAIDLLNPLAVQGYVEAQYTLGRGFYEIGVFNQAINWLILADEKEHPEAAAFLNESSFNPIYYTLIAINYETGEVVKKNIGKALLYYTKASELGDIKASFKLGQFYELGIAEVLDKNLNSAFKYYLISAKKHHEEALASIRRLSQDFDDNNDESLLLLADFYFVYTDSKTEALKYYMRLANKNNHVAINEINKLINDPKIAYQLAQLYQNDDSNEKNIQTACKYYLSAMNGGSVEARERLELLANNSNDEAQYCLGCWYYKERNFEQAISWLAKSGERNNKAIQYLLENFGVEYCLLIAGMFENGKETKKNIKLAIVFYKRAFNLGEKNVALKLGQLYQVDQTSPIIKRNNDKAFKYFYKALKGGFIDALDPLERLGEEVSTEKQIKLGNLYTHGLYRDLRKSAYWYQLALDAGDVNAQYYLKQLANFNKFDDLSSGPATFFFKEKDANQIKQKKRLNKLPKL